LDLGPCGPLRGALRVPGDKSVTHRGLMLLALAEGEGAALLPSEGGGDTLSTARVLRALGAEIEEEGPHFRVRGRGPSA
jgi:3-phosphoshikimate 1-carboxyvinyltransferase